MDIIKQFEGKEIRINLDDNGDPWFVAQDVMESLDIKSQAHALRKLDESERGVFEIQGSNGFRKFTTVSESGLYALIMDSRKKSAREFRMWITKEVLPSIRKTGSYSIKEMDPLDQLKLHLTIMEKQRNEIKKLNSSLKIVAEEAKQLNDTLTSDQITILDKEIMNKFKELGGKEYRIIGLIKKAIKNEFFEITGSRTFKEIPRSGFELALEIVKNFQLPKYLE